MNFFILITPSVFWETPRNMGNFSENGEIYTYNIIYIMPIV